MELTMEDDQLGIPNRLVCLFLLQGPSSMDCQCLRVFSYSMSLCLATSDWGSKGWLSLDPSFLYTPFLPPGPWHPKRPS